MSKNVEFFNSVVEVFISKLKGRNILSSEAQYEVIEMNKDNVLNATTNDFVVFVDNLSDNGQIEMGNITGLCVAGYDDKLAKYNYDESIVVSFDTETKEFKFISNLAENGRKCALDFLKLEKGKIVESNSAMFEPLLLKCSIPGDLLPRSEEFEKYLRLTK